jgi:hypothetical protein
MKTITLINPENALRILNECSLTTKSDNISVTNGDVVSLIFNSKQYNKENFGHTLRIGFDGGGIVGIRNAYIEIDLYKFDDIIEIELPKVNYYAFDLQDKYNNGLLKVYLDVIQYVQQYYYESTILQQCK